MQIQHKGYKFCSIISKDFILINERPDAEMVSFSSFSFLTESA